MNLCLKEAVGERIPNLTPLLLFLADGHSPVDSPTCLDILDDLMRTPKQPCFMKAFVNGVLFGAWTGMLRNDGDDMFLGGDQIRVSAFQYGWIVQKWRLEPCMLYCFYVSDLHCIAEREFALQLCRTHPEIASSIFPYIHRLFGKKGGRTVSRNENSDGVHALETFNAELLRLCVEHLEQADIARVDRVLDRVADLLLETLEDSLSENTTSFAQFYLKCLKRILGKCRGFSEFAEKLPMDLLASEEHDNGQHVFNDLRTVLNELKAILAGRKSDRAIESPTRSGFENVEWLDPCFASQTANRESCLQCFDAVRRDLGKAALRENPYLTEMLYSCVGWALSQVYSTNSFHQKPLDIAILEALVHRLFQLICERPADDGWVFHSALIVLDSVLKEVQGEEDQKRLLRSLNGSRLYLDAVAVIESKSILTQSASRRAIRLTNQLMECGPTHEGVVSDKQHDQQQLSAWISVVLSCFVLFPSITIQHVTRNSVLYTSQQRRLIQALRFFSVSLGFLRPLVITTLASLMEEMESIPSESLSSFAKDYFSGDGSVGESFFLEDICAETFLRFSSPNSTTEGLLRGAEAVLHSTKQRGLVPTCLKFLESLTPIFRLACSPGTASCPTFAATLDAAEKLFATCEELLISLRSNVTEEQASGLTRLCWGLDWNLRIRFIGLMDLFADEKCTLCDRISPFLPDCLNSLSIPTESVDQRTDVDAGLWMQVLTQMLWFGSLSDENASSVRRALQDPPNNGHSLRDRLAQSFTEKLQHLPVELTSWTAIMSMTELASTATSSCLERVIRSILPPLLKRFIGDEDRSEADAISLLVLEVYCRTLYVIGAHSDMQEYKRSHVLCQSQAHLSRFCTETLKTTTGDSRDLFVLRSFMEVASLMASMKETSFDYTELQMLLTYLLQDLVTRAIKHDEGLILPSGLSLDLVLQWIDAFIEPIGTSSRNYIILAMNTLVKNKLKHL